MNFTPFKVVMITIWFFALQGCNNHDEKEYQGYIDGDLTFLAPHYSGIVEKLNVQEGENVRKNQLLIQLELEPQQAQFKQATFELASAEKTLENLKKGERQTVIVGIEAEIAKAQSELQLAQIRLDRTKALFEKNLSNKDALDQATTEYNTKLDSLKLLKAKLEEAKLGGRVDVILAQEARVGAAQARKDELQWALDSKKIYAPDDGFIYNIFYRQGEFVPVSKPILSMITPYNQYIVFFLPVKRLEGIKINSHVFVTCEGCKKNYDAKISFISPKVEYTPPVIFSREHHDKYIYRVHAKLSKDDVFNFHLGQPVFVKLQNEL